MVKPSQRAAPQKECCKAVGRTLRGVWLRREGGWLCLRPVAGGAFGQLGGGQLFSSAAPAGPTSSPPMYTARSFKTDVHSELQTLTYFRGQPVIPA